MLVVANSMLMAGSQHESIDLAGRNGAQILVRSLIMVGVAELFDKTWFMGLLLAMKYNPATVFVGSFAALLLHCIFAAAFGYAFARFLSPTLLHFLAAGLFSFFALLYMKDWFMADPNGDVIQSGKEEVGNDMGVTQEDDIKKPLKEAKKAGKSEVEKRWRVHMWIFIKSFVAVFIAEWGDRTQIAMIGQHASQPLIPVFLGSVVAFFLLTLSAVGVARILTDQKLSERLVFGVSAVCFTVFAALSLKDGCVLLHRKHMNIVT